MIERLAEAAAVARSDQIARILNEAFIAPEQRWSAESVAGTLKMPGTAAFLAPDRASDLSAPQACAVLRSVADEAEILTLAVLPAARRSGLGIRLVAACLDEAAAAGALRVHLEVGARNVPARALYARAGFVETGWRPRYYHGGAGREDAVLLARDAGPIAPAGAGPISPRSAGR